MRRRDYGIAINCKWFLAGEGVCTRCGTERRLYTPENTTHKLCAPCTQIVATSALVDSGGEDEVDDEETPDDIVERIRYMAGLS